MIPAATTWTSWLIVSCWTVWGAVWVAGAVHNARHGPPVRRRRRPGLGVVIVVLVVWVLLVSAGNSLHWPVSHAGWLRACGALLLVAGTAFAIWARIVLGTMWSSTAVAKEAHRLRTDGPYGVTRHPIYTGMLGMVLGSALLAGSAGWLGAALAALAVIVLKIRQEERLLGETFPDDYPQYRRRVPQLVPGLRLGPGRGRRA